MNTALRDIGLAVELGQRALWALMTPAEYDFEYARLQGWIDAGAALPTKWGPREVPQPMATRRSNWPWKMATSTATTNQTFRVVVSHVTIKPEQD